MRKSLRLALRQPAVLCKNGCFCKKMDEEFESLQTNSYIQKEKAQRKNPCAFSGAEGETRRVFNPSCSLCEQFILCPFLLRKKMDEEFESLCPFCNIQKKGTGKNPIPFLAQKERLDGFSTRRVRSANSLFYVPFCSAKRRTKSSSLSKQIHIYKKKKHKGKILVLFLAQKERLELSRRLPDLRP